MSDDLASVNFPPEKIPKMDWADEIADSLYNTYAAVPEIAAAIRSAKADGMREAINAVAADKAIELSDSLRSLAVRILRRASEIEAA